MTWCYEIAAHWWQLLTFVGVIFTILLMNARAGK